MKKKNLSSTQLGLMSIALIKNLFPKPFRGELLVEGGLQDGSCNLYFNNDYHDRLYSKIREKYLEGEFAKSNSESDWIDFMNAINLAEETLEDTSKLTNYHLLERAEEETKQKIEINENKLTEILNSERPLKQGWIGDLMEDIIADITSVYQGHTIGYNFHGHILIERIIDTNSMIATKIKILPLLKILNKYNVEIDTFEIMRLFNPEKLNTSIYLKKDVRFKTK